MVITANGRPVRWASVRSSRSTSSGVGPVEVGDDHEHRALAGQAVEVGQHRLDDLVAGPDAVDAVERGGVAEQVEEARW